MALNNRRFLTLSLLLALVATLLLAPAAMADLLTPESGGSPNADRIDTLYKLTFAVGIVVFVGVEGALIYALIKFRARKGAIAAQIHGNTRLEIGWTIGAAVILVVLAVITFAMLGGIRTPENSSSDGLALASPGTAVADDGGTSNSEKRLPPNGKSLNITVNGQQYVWRYTYPDGDSDPLNDPFTYEQMVVPTNTTVTLDIRAQDVIHSWWIPELGGKMDAVPGYTNYTWFKIEKPGVYRGQCAELCGRGHANMIASVRAVAPAEYEAFIERLKADIQTADDEAAASRKRLEADPNATP
jgi:cytochrome c oxidase subunit 2